MDRLSKSATNKRVSGDPIVQESGEPPVDEAESLKRPGIVPDKLYSASSRKIKKVYRRRDSSLRLNSRQIKKEMDARDSIAPLVPTKEHLKQIENAANKAIREAKKLEAAKKAEDKTPKNKTSKTKSAKTKTKTPAKNKTPAQKK